MRRSNQLMLVLLSLFVATMGIARAAELSFVAGSIVQPEGVNEGDTLQDGTVVETGPDGMAMVEYRWPSDEPGIACIQVVIFGYGQKHTVGGDETPGRCQTMVATEPGNMRAGEPFLTKGTRYGDAATDSFNEKVGNSHIQWRDFDQWTRNAERTFTGDVVSAGGNRITLRSPVSQRQVSFVVESSTVRPVPLDSLTGKRVRVDYQISAIGRKAVRIRPMAPVVDHRILPTPVVIPGKPDARVIQPPSGRAGGGDGGRQAQTDIWFCNVDLHQGDSGTMEFSRHGDTINGVMIITRGAQRHPISGTWKGDDIAFRRTLSANSGQQFKGTVSAAKRGEARMAGRFAHDFRGVWSADCALQPEPEEEPPAGADGKRCNVVLTRAGDNTIELIKTIRSVTGLGLRESKEATENLPFTLKTDVSIQEARQIKSALEKAGAGVKIEKQP